MNYTLFAILAVVMIGLVILTVEILIPWAITTLGTIDSWWSPFRTLPPPGEMYIIVRGDPSGPFDDVIESVVSFHYNRQTRMFTDKLPPPSETYLRHLGVTWVGLWRYRLWREVRYDKWEKRSDNSTEWALVSKTHGVRGKQGDSPSIFFRYNMATQIKAAETVGNFPVDGIMVFTVQIINPALAFFLAGGWESQTTAAVQGCFRRYVSNKTIDKLREEQITGGGTLVDQIKGLTTHLFRLFGVEIIDAQFVLFDLVSGDRDEAMIRATRALQIETLNAEANAKKGEGERRQRQERAIGVRAEVEAWGAHSVGGTVAMAEAIKEAKPNVLGGNIIASVEGTR